MAKQAFLVSTLIMAIVICLTIEQSQAKPKKGCEAFGHACYGGHGKRSVTPTVGVGEMQQIHPADSMSQIYLNDGTALQQYRRNRLMNIWKQFIEGRRLYSGAPTERMNDNDIEYLTSNEIYKDNSGLN